MFVTALALGATALAGPAAGMVVGVAGAAISQVAQGKNAKAIAEAQRSQEIYNAQLDERNARAAELKAKFDQIRHQRYAQGVMGRLRARLGASGAITTEGAPVALFAEQASELALESALIGYEGMTSASQYRSQAALRYQQADIYHAQGRSAQRAANIGAGTTLLSGFTQMGQMGMFGESTFGLRWRT